MGEISQGLRKSAGENQARDRAVSAFLILGERLRSLYARNKERPRLDAGSTDNDVGVSALFDTIEGEIIPRLMLAHKTAAEAPPPVADPADPITREEHARFVHIIMTDSAAAAQEIVAGILARDVPRETIYLNLLANCARALGEMWERDECDFTDVTIGLCRLHEVLRNNSDAWRQDNIRAGSAGEGARILLTTACGDQHVFGVVMVAEFFRAAGWRVWSEPGASCAELKRIVEEQHFDVIGLSAACNQFADDIADQIDELRAASVNPDVKIMVGGRMFFEMPGLVEKVGADAFAHDAQVAPSIGQNVLAAARIDC